MKTPLRSSPAAGVLLASVFAAGARAADRVKTESGVVEGHG